MRLATMCRCQLLKQILVYMVELDLFFFRVNENLTTSFSNFGLDSFRESKGAQLYTPPFS